MSVLDVPLHPRTRDVRELSALAPPALEPSFSRATRPGPVVKRGLLLPNYEAFYSTLRTALWFPFPRGHRACWALLVVCGAVVRLNERREARVGGLAAKQV